MDSIRLLPDSEVDTLVNMVVAQDPSMILHHQKHYFHIQAVAAVGDHRRSMLPVMRLVL